ncbi:MAG: hypothetical protein LBC96_08980 [Lachnospiraceae bacterium]|jgi:ABC-2 type transport system permease protein|nr:hypothetical protein [Lachnospiraceae bacterium]
MFAGNIILCKLILRRDWLRILIWFVVMAALVLGFGSAINEIVGTDESLANMTVMMANPAMVAMMGQTYFTADGVMTIGSIYATMMLVWSALFMGIMNIFHVVRHTRADEERGRIEVIRSLPVGRLSSLSSTMTVAVAMNVIFAVLLGLGLSVVGTGGMEDLGGAMMFGCQIGVAGLAFAVITAIFCQICSNPRTAMGFSFFVLIMMYMIRAAADMQENIVLSIISPLGIIQMSKVYVENLLWPALLSLAFSVVGAGLAFYLCSARDMGAGLVAPKPGKRDAAPYLSSPRGLAWRLLKTPFIIWAIAIPSLSMSYGSIMGDIETFIESIPALQEMTGGDPLILVGFFMVLMALMVTIPSIQFLLKARSQESGGYAEHILARAASRYDQLSGYFIIALVCGVLMPFLNSVGFWLACYATMDDPLAFSSILVTCMIYTPAVLFMLGLAMILLAYLPERTSIVWMYMGYSFAVLYLGALMGLPEWLSYLSPFGLIPQLPADEVTGASVLLMVILTVAAATMYVLGFKGYRDRDMKFSH